MLWIMVPKNSKEYITITTTEFLALSLIWYSENNIKIDCL